MEIDLQNPNPIINNTPYQQSKEFIDERTKLLYSLSIIVMSFVSLPNDNGKLIVSVFDSVDVPMPVITSRSEGL